MQTGRKEIRFVLNLTSSSYKTKRKSDRRRERYASKHLSLNGNMCGHNTFNSLNTAKCFTTSSVQFKVVLLHSLNTAKCFYNEFSSVQFTVVLLHSLNTAKCFITSSVQFMVVLLHSLNTAKRFTTSSVQFSSS